MNDLLNTAIANKVGELRSALEPLMAEVASIQTVIDTLTKNNVPVNDWVKNTFNAANEKLQKARTATVLVKISIGEDNEPTYEIINSAVNVKPRTTGVTTAAHNVTVNGTLFTSSSEAMKTVFPNDYRAGEDSAAKLFGMAAKGLCSLAKGDVVIENGMVIAGDITSLGNEKITKMFATK